MLIRRLIAVIVFTHDLGLESCNETGIDGFRVFVLGREGITLCIRLGLLTLEQGLCVVKRSNQLGVGGLDVCNALGGL